MTAYKHIVSRAKQIAGLLLPLALVVLATGCSEDQEMVVVKPAEIDSFLLNPGRGFTSTSNVYNENLVNRLHSPSGISQQRFSWDSLEPEEGKIRYELIDSAVARAGRNGQLVNFRVMCQDVDMTIPAWSVRAGVRSPFYDNQVFIEKQINLIKALGKRYDGDPNICFVDIGTVGQWGEWHVDPDAPDPAKIVFPSDENARKVIDAYLAAFRKTPLVALIAFKQKYGFGYATSKGTGWRADCWGDMDSLGWNHMKGVYPQALDLSNAHDSWKNGPIAFETCWTMDEWFKRGWDIDYILGKALEWHATGVNNGNQAIPAEWYPKVKEFEKKLGYRFVIEEVRYPVSASKGSKISVDFTWQNKGVAPVYNPYDLSLRFVSKTDNKQYLIQTDADVRKWFPGKSEYSTKVELPAEINPGDYELQVGLLRPGTQKAVVQLAIAGKTADGWYRIGDFSVSK